ncbi:probable G-protein coupled receptor 82 [Polyodon spathula]|uniref:probable G-protein coupled receptor 82 n=1 Tax=Polyodon spathula TaxID=7913 RepID=UPI001B7F2FCC|nr:probable G-protein coupled receptor 82 [Polyodon spathula]
MADICNITFDNYQKDIFTWLYSALTIVGFLSNGAVLWDLWKAEKTVTGIFTINMTAADLLLCCSFPFRIVYYQRSSEWEPNAHLCTATIFTTVSLFYINLYCNICFLMWICINRYASVVRPKHVFFKFFKTPKICKFLCALTWTVTLCATLSNLIHNLLKNSVPAKSCFDLIASKTRNNYNLLHALCIALFFFILIILLTFYTLLVYHLQRMQDGNLVMRNQNISLQVRRKILATVLVFVVCFVPYHIERAMLLLSNSSDCTWQRKQYKAKAGTILLAALSCCVLPLLHLSFHFRCCKARAASHTRNIHPHTHEEHAIGYRLPETTRS